MSNKVKDVDIKDRTYYFFNDIINIKKSDQTSINIDEKSYRNILLYYIGYETTKDLKDSKYVKINSVNPLYLTFNKVNGYLEEINGNKWLMLVPTNESNSNNNNKK